MTYDEVRRIVGCEGRKFTLREKDKTDEQEIAMEFWLPFRNCQSPEHFFLVFHDGKVVRMYSLVPLNPDCSF